jgi:hypothetical protein
MRRSITYIAILLFVPLAFPIAIAAAFIYFLKKGE